MVPPAGAGGSCRMKTVVFLCPHNALRSVIAAALFNRDADGVARADRVVSLGCPLEPELAAAAAGKLEEWPMPDTTGKPVKVVREVRDLIQQRVDALLVEYREGG